MHEHLDDVARKAAVRPADPDPRGHVDPRVSAALHLQRSAGNAAVVSRLDDDDERSPVLDVVGRGGGRPLPPTVQATMERSVGADLSGVRVHDDARASASAEAVSARAYTVGDDVVFGAGEYQPETAEGLKTLAHELTHVVQQREGPVDGAPAAGGIRVSDPDDRFERAAEENAERVVHRLPAEVAAGPPGPAAMPGVQREAMPEEEEPVQTIAVQREAMPEEEEPVQAISVQREAMPEEEEPMQG